MIASLLVFVQFASLFLVIFSGAILPLGLLPLIIILTGLAIGSWAVYTMRTSRWNIRPTVHKKAQLVTTGPYRIIRHPMYSAVILVCLGVAINHPNSVRVGALSILIINFWLKLSYEEKYLSKHFHNYKQYQKNTYRLIPFLY